MVAVAEWLQNRPARGRLLDGGVGTALIARGLPVGQIPTEAWNLTEPRQVVDVHGRFAAAGSSIVQTNTFGANRIRLRHFGREDDARVLNLEGVRLARAAAPEGVLVFGSIGPTGQLPPPEGRLDLFDLEDAFAEQAAALAEGGVDAIHIETAYHPKEARAAIRGSRRGAPQTDILVSMSCRAVGDGFRTSLGYTAEQMLAVLLEEQVAGVGANCTLAPADMLDLVRLLRSRTDLPVLAKPTTTPSASAPLLPEEFATGCLALLSAGASLVGGCCGTSPSDIEAARVELARH